MTQTLGTPYYTAPEVFKKKYDTKCDMWSLGVILYILLCGKFPFSVKKTETLKDLKKKIIKGDFSFKHEGFKDNCGDAKDLIRKLLKKKPSLRLSAKDTFAHPFIQKLTETSYRAN